MVRGQCAVAVVLAMGLGCGGRPGAEGGPGEVSAPAGSGAVATERGEPKGFRTRASAMTKTYAERLRAELTRAIQDGGTARAIAVCSERAPEIAQEVATPTTTIRRIGTRVRNRANNTPTPAQRAVLERLTPAEPEYVGTLDGTPTFLKAIFIQDALCLQCHGARDDLASEVVAALAERYPDDEATGYQPGDLRGAFVVEARETPAGNQPD